MDINIFIYRDYETLDIFGPVEILSQIEDYRLLFFSLNGGVVTNHHGVQLITQSAADIHPEGILLIGGGKGNRALINDQLFLDTLRDLSNRASYVLSVCTGSALLARCGALDNRQATSNKLSLNWVKEMGPNTNWVDEARWVVDGKFYTASGVSAGMDMTMGFVSDQFGESKARDIATFIEYRWQEDANMDPFSIRHTERT